jgi:hypothetical protein
MTSETPRTHPDSVVDEMVAVAQSNGYEVRAIELVWHTEVAPDQLMSLMYGSTESQQ